MNREYARAVLAEVTKRAAKNNKPKLILNSLFHKQREFVLDPSLDKAALCTRRAGKSHSAAAMLYLPSLLKPGTTALYMALTRFSAYNIMWPALNRMAAQFDIKAKFSESDLTVTLENGSRIWLVGADLKNFIERLRGGSYSISIIDEAQSFRSHLNNLIDDVLKPALLDLRGPLCLLGTPGILPVGTFYDATTKDVGYSIHKWSLYDNPHLPDPRGYIEALKKKRGWTDDNPTYLREYCGQWVIDLDALLYRFKYDRNAIESSGVNGQTGSNVIAVDFGWNDATAFTVCRYSKHSKKVIVIHSEAHKEWTVSEIAGRLKQLRSNFDPVSIVADTGGLGKTIAEELRRRHEIPLKAASKTDKLSWITLLNGDLIDGNMLISKNNIELIDQIQTLQKGDDGIEDPNMPCDLADAMLYAYRECKHYLGEVLEEKPVEGSHEWAKHEERKILEQELEQYDRESKKAWWE